MIISLSGSNSFAMSQRLDELVSAFVSKHSDLALERFDAEETEAQSIIDSLQSLPFLAERKMVVVRQGNANKQFTEQIEQVIGSVSGDVDLILYEPEIDRRTSYFKLLKKHTKFEEFNPLDKNGLARWLVQEAEKQGAKISRPDATYLVERVGDNQQLLFNELTKLAIYNPEISRQNIDLLTEPTPQSKVFDLIDAAFGGKKEKALELYEDQRAQKVEPEAILAMIAWQLELLTLVKFAKDKSTAEIAKDTGLNPFPLNKAASLARRLEEPKLKHMVDEAYKIDLKNKTTSIDLDEALKTYIVTL
ncbi:MAG TPA: DNA polymerase III subunit delta [Candidatus Saccharimonadales bacterium]|nr:DNA polymerase III subunit delta [Candidatus Saccharimonadales bacterium]